MDEASEIQKRTIAIHLEKFDALTSDKQNAFLALFAGARHNIMIFINPDGKRERPHFGKAECEWIDDWEDFYTRELPSLGWIKFEIITDPKPALGMKPGWTYIEAQIEITPDGQSTREMAHFR